MSITLDDRPETPLHPLDLTAESPEDDQLEFCIGLIQTADSQLLNPSNDLGDIILGVPFLPKVYAVMAYAAPDANGPREWYSNQTIAPRLGLLSLTDPTIAIEEFYTVRELNQPISGGGNSTGGSAGDSSSSNSIIYLGGKKMSVGIVVLIGIPSFFALCGVLFVTRWFIIRLTYRKDDNFGVELAKTISCKDEKGSRMGSFKSKLEEVALAVGVGGGKDPF